MERLPFDCAVTLYGKEYKFESIEDDPLVFIMKIDATYEVYRHISCDGPYESLTLIKTYTSVKNGITNPKDTFKTDIYNGKEIESHSFMTELLEHGLFGIANY